MPIAAGTAGIYAVRTVVSVRCRVQRDKRAVVEQLIIDRPDLRKRVVTEKVIYRPTGLVAVGVAFVIIHFISVTETFLRSCRYRPATDVILIAHHS